jgi:deoxycytidylate deaminase
VAGVQSHIDLSYPDAELVFGLAYPVGTDYSGVQLALGNYLRRFNYQPNFIKISDSIREILSKVDVGMKLSESCEADRIDSYMTAGNKLCEAAGRPDFLTAAAIATISKPRTVSSQTGQSEPIPRTAHVLLSLKRPAEVELLRSVYRSGFYLIGVFAPEIDRLRYLTNDKNIPKKTARRLMRRDEEEEVAFGQHSRDTFQLADVFIRLKGEEYKEQLERFLDLVFGYPHGTPTADEHAMFLANCAALRSGQLSRQVGSAIRSATGEILALGANDVPKPGGGLYWPGPEDERDHARGYDSNDAEQLEIAADIIERLKISKEPDEAMRALQRSRLSEITEYGRAVHAEMDALLTCSRVGSSVRGATLFSTTFPCHNCTRHIIAAGLSRVVYIEPYPKSKATKLHRDAIYLVGAQQPDFKGRSRIPFEPFVGIGPRRFYDLFSMRMSSGYVVVRKRDGKAVRWRREHSSPRVQALPTSYIQREKLAAEVFRDKIGEMEEVQHGIQRLSFEKK